MNKTDVTNVKYLLIFFAKYLLFGFSCHIFASELVTSKLYSNKPKPNYTSNNPSLFQFFRENCLISGKTALGFSPLVVSYKHHTIMTVHDKVC